MHFYVSQVVPFLLSDRPVCKFGIHVWQAMMDPEALKAAMARDRAEVAARGPSQSSVARKLGDGGSQSSAIFQEQEEAEGRRNAQ